MHQAICRVRKHCVLRYISRHRMSFLALTAAIGLLMCILALLSEQTESRAALIQPTTCPTLPVQYNATDHKDCCPCSHVCAKTSDKKCEEKQTHPPHHSAADAMLHTAVPDTPRVLLRRPANHPGTLHDSNRTRHGQDSAYTRVLITVVASHFIVRRETCYAVASAYFTGLPIVVIGYGEEQKHNNTRKIEYALRAVDRIGLREDDVVMIFDNDLMFTGQDMLPYIDRFIAQSPPSPRELDAKAVREGRAMAPSVFSSETNCYAPQITEFSVPLCMVTYADRERLLVRYARKYNAHRSSSSEFKPYYTPLGELPRHINTGASIHRVWAMRSLWEAMGRFMKDNRPNGLSDKWESDQSVLTGVYFDLLRWEVQKEVFTLNSSMAQQERTRYGVRGGQMGLDVENELSGVVPIEYSEAYELTSELWSKKDKARIEPKIHDSTAVAQLVDAVQNQSQKPPFATRILQPLVNARKLRYAEHDSNDDDDDDSDNTMRDGKETVTIELSPPLLATTPRLINGSMRRVYPLTVHYAGYPKEPRLSDLLSHMPWYLPMSHNRTAWGRNWEYIRRMPIELWSVPQHMQASYAEACAEMFVNGTEPKP